jgi:PKD repeat protein
VSTQQNASHTYVANGNYSWTLTVSAGGANCTKNGTLTVSSAGTNKIRRRSVTRPADPSSYSVNVSPSSSPQTFSFGGASVTLPGGTLTSAQTLTIRQLSNAAPPNYKGLQQMAAYDIRLGDLHTFKTPLTIRLKYDPKALRTDLPAERVVSASYWDPEQSAWVALPSTLDTAKSEVVVTARHLSLFSWSMLKLG